MAGEKIDQYLNTTQNGKETPTEYDQKLNKWVQHTRNVDVITFPPVTGKKAVGLTPIKACVTDEPLSERYMLAVFNPNAITVYWGAADVTIENGYPLPSNSAVEFQFNPAIPVDIYFVSEDDTVLRVVELK